MGNGKNSWKPWHQVVSLRNDVLTGELSLAEFAADLHEVVMQEGIRPIYENAEQFFGLTYPTLTLRDIARDVIHRLAAQNTKAIQQLELTFGGGKTHTLITLRHLVSDPDSLPDSPSVQQFKSHIGISFPKSRVVALCFDKIDVEKGMKVYGPSSESRWLKYPWSILAFQIAGDEGLKILHADGKAEERETPPAEPLLNRILKIPQESGLSTLILVDEILMYATVKITMEKEWENHLVNFFQYLCQAVTKVDKCAMVASILASDPEKNNELGKRVAGQISNIFGRQSEVGVQPVQQEDIAEVLRRRFFESSSINDSNTILPNVTFAVSNITKLHSDNNKERKKLEEQFLKNFPFHPNLTNIFYTRWSQVSQFQRTRGVLRTFALALRDAEKWDNSPLIGPNVFLSEPKQQSISEAAKELANTANSESQQDSEGGGHEWRSILEGELSKAREIQIEQPGLNHRELEQAVFSVFISSMPIGQKASTSELISLIGSNCSDRIELEKALQKWTEISWFLDESEFEEIDSSQGNFQELPKSWRLGNKPNLKQMHYDACKNRVTNDSVDNMLKTEIENSKFLTRGASALGARVHMLPEHPKEISNDEAFHYVILGPNSMSESGKPSNVAKKFIEETTGPDRPRTNRNAILIVTPSKEGLESVKSKVRDFLGWKEVEILLKNQQQDSVRDDRVSGLIKSTQKQISSAIEQAWSIVVTVSASNEIQAFKLSIGQDSLFSAIKSDKRSRIRETPISSDALVPGGPYDLWLKDEPSRLVKDLYSAFAETPKLPKMLKNTEILETIKSGIISGTFVASLKRPDKSIRTWWRTTIEETDLKDSALELYLPDKIELSEIPLELLSFNTLPNLWRNDHIKVSDVIEYFSGGGKVEVQLEGYVEAVRIPNCSRENVELSIRKAVEQGVLRLVDGTKSFQEEKVPEGFLNDSSQLFEPMMAMNRSEILPSGLENAWNDGQANASVMLNELVKKTETPIPWSVFCETIKSALDSGWLEYAPESRKFPCDAENSKEIQLKIPSEATRVSKTDGVKTIAKENSFVKLNPRELQDLLEKLPDILKSADELDIRFNLGVTLENSNLDVNSPVITEINKILGQVNDDLKI